MSLPAGGMRPWLWQRLTALYMVFFSGFFLLSMGINTELNFVTWRAWLMHPLVNIGVILFWLALLGHAWVGARDVVLDYVSHVALRFSVLVLIGGYLLAMTIWVLKVLVVAA